MLHDMFGWHHLMQELHREATVAQPRQVVGLWSGGGLVVVFFLHLFVMRLTKCVLMRRIVLAFYVLLSIPLPGNVVDKQV